MRDELQRITPSLLGFEHYHITTKRLPCPLLDSGELRDHLRICPGDMPSDASLRRAVLSATQMVESQTGYIVSPRVIQIQFDNWPTAILQRPNVAAFTPANIPLPLSPVWSDADLARYLAAAAADIVNPAVKAFAQALSVEFASGASIAVSYYPSSDGSPEIIDPAAYRLDTVRRPQALMLKGSCDWPCAASDMPITVKLIVGYQNVSEIEIENALIVEAVVLAATQLYDQPESFADVLKSQQGIWDMIGFKN